MTWRIVKFGEPAAGVPSSSATGTKPVSVVPQTWLFKEGDKDLCWWPSQAYSNVTGMVRKMLFPQQDWEQWHVAKVYGDTFDDFLQAKEKLSSASYATSLEGSIEPAKKKVYGRGKRSLKRERSEEEESSVKHPKQLNTIRELPNVLPDEEELNESATIPPCTEMAVENHTEQDSNPMTDLLHDILKEMKALREEMKEVKVEVGTLRKDVEELKRMNQESSEALYVKVSFYGEMNREILKEIKERGKFVTTPPTLPLPFKIPITDWSHFCDVMVKLQEDSVKELLIRHLSLVGGRDITVLTNGVMGRLMFRSFAQKCSWKGQRGEKYALGNTPLLGIVHGAVIRHAGYQHTTEEAVKLRIQNWIKQAGRKRPGASEE